MASLGAVAGQVGLQLLLTPSTSNFVFKATSLVLGTAYPIYASVALIESHAPAKEREQQATQWLTYWAAYGLISAAEQMVASRPPLYYHLKLALLFWLQSSQYQGARRLYLLLLRPFLQRHSQEIDACLSFVHALMTSPGVKYVGQHVHNLVAKVPYLSWFVLPFDDGARRARNLL